MTGFSIDVAFIGNLIQSNGNGSEFDGKTFIGCQGVVSDSDPQLGPLQVQPGRHADDGDLGDEPGTGRSRSRCVATR